MNRFCSIIREEEYKRVEKLEINGEILDLGGSKKSGYHELIRGTHKITTVNISEEAGCDMIFDIQKPFPLPDDKFDAVLSLNVFEHVFNFQNSFSEARRILKKDGLFIISVPFFHQIHGSPDDFFRFTSSSLKKLLGDQNFVIESIGAIGFGLFSLIFQLVGGIFPVSIRSVLKTVCVSIDKFLLSVSSGYNKLAERIPLGYFVVARLSK